MAQAMQALTGFLNSALGVLLIGSLIGAVGLFTWQRQDWIFKEIYLRSQVLLDRQIELIEKINRDVGRFCALANDGIAVIEKEASDEEISKATEAYNVQEAEWFSKTVAYKAMLRLYFKQQSIPDKFTNIIDATGEVDKCYYKYWKERSQERGNQAWKASGEVTVLLEALNTLVLQQLHSTSSYRLTHKGV